MANVKIVEREGREPRVKLFSSHNNSVMIIPYAMWQDIKAAFDINEDTVDAYDYVNKYDDLYLECSSYLISPLGEVF